MVQATFDFSAVTDQVVIGSGHVSSVGGRLKLDVPSSFNLGRDGTSILPKYVPPFIGGTYTIGSYDPPGDYDGKFFPQGRKVFTTLPNSGGDGGPGDPSDAYGMRPSGNYAFAMSQPNYKLFMTLPGNFPSLGSFLSSGGPTASDFIDTEAYQRAVFDWNIAADQKPVTRIELVAYHPDPIAVAYSVPILFSEPVKARDLFASEASPFATPTPKTIVTEAFIVGSPYGEDITGIPLGPNTFTPSLGRDQLNGGSVDDVFDYRLATGVIEPQRLNGRDHTSGGGDTLKLPGSSSDYILPVDLWGAAPHRTLFPRPEFALSTITRVPPNGQTPELVLEVTTIEKVTFETAMTNVVSVKPGNIASEMLLLAAEVYGPLPTLEHGKEALAYESTGTAVPYREDITAPAQTRGWHALSALEMRMAPADYEQHGGLRYTFTNGFYAAYDANAPILFEDRAEANALVLTGIVEGKRTLAISFRGTDQKADARQDWPDFKTHYDKYKPLIDAVDAYIFDVGADGNQGNDIQQVLVSGHSLGAGMSQYFMHAHRNDPQLEKNPFFFRDFTSGSPGSDVVGANDQQRPIANFVHTDDKVGLGPALTQLVFSDQVTGFSAAAGVTAAVFAGPVGGVGLILLGLIPAAGSVLGEEKYREGGEVLIDRLVSYGNAAGDQVVRDIDAHDKYGYADDARLLEMLAAEKDSPFYRTELAASLRDARPYTGPQSVIAPGGEFKDILNVPVTGSVNYSIGGRGDDKFCLSAETSAPGFILIDGGDGRDAVHITNLRFDFVKAGTGFQLTFDGRVVGHAYRVEAMLRIDDAERIQRVEFDLHPELARKPFKGDVMLQNLSSGQVVFGQMMNGEFAGWGAVTDALGSGDFRALASGDVNPGPASGPETFIQQLSTGSIYFASQDSGETTWGVVSTTLTPDWQLRAVADINGDGSVDAIIQNQGDGTIYYGDMRGGTFQGWGVVNGFLTPDWVAVGAGDVNGDGNADVVVQQQSTGTAYFADMAGGQFAGWGVVSTTLTADWKVRAVADVTGDGRADVIFQNSVGGDGINPGTAYFADLKTGVVEWGVVTTTVDADWVVQGTADVDSDGDADVLFQNAAGGNGINPGTTYYARMGPGGFEGWGAIATNITADWHVL